MNFRQTLIRQTKYLNSSINI